MLPGLKVGPLLPYRIATPTITDTHNNFQYILTVVYRCVPGGGDLTYTPVHLYTCNHNNRQSIYMYFYMYVSFYYITMTFEPIAIKATFTNTCIVRVHVST